VADVDSVGRVSSDLSFAIWRDVRALKMIPASRTIVTIEGAEHKEAVLKSLGADPA
jgi:hypothetical protein